MPELRICKFRDELLCSAFRCIFTLFIFLILYRLFTRTLLNSWQVISPVETKGVVVVVDELLEVEDKVYDRPTILVAGRVRGEEEIPDGAVAVLTPDMPDILSHVSVRARNGKVITLQITLCTNK